MLPVIALVGRPNVGKSTLFNRLTKTRNALVADFPGLTRDRQYGEGKLGSSTYLVIDTGGITGEEEGIDAAMAKQSFLAIEEADLVLFMVDAKTGLSAADEYLNDHLRRINKRVLLVVNKIDGLDAASAAAEFYSLGLAEQPWLIAATQNRGITQLINYSLELLLGKSTETDAEASANADEAASLDEQQEAEPLTAEEQKEQERKLEKQLAEESKKQAARPLKFGVIGRPNVGKSTLVNRILGEERVIVYDEPGTTRDALSIPFQRNGKEYILVDTAGIRRRKSVKESIEKFSIIKTLQAIEECQVAILVLDARTGLVEQDLHLISFVLETGRALVIAVNKWDNLEEELKDKIKKDINQRLGFVDYAQVHFISALHGTGVGEVVRSVNKAYRSATSHWSTNQLTTLLQDVMSEHQPPMVNSRRIKLRYAHQGGINPPIFVIHGNQTSKLPQSYQSYLMKSFRQVLGITGTPLRFEFKSGHNPYVNSQKPKTSREQAKARQLRLTKEARKERRERRKR